VAKVVYVLAAHRSALIILVVPAIVLVLGNVKEQDQGPSHAPSIEHFGLSTSIPYSYQD
jgi:hypothetical protein